MLLVRPRGTWWGVFLYTELEEAAKNFLKKLSSRSTTSFYLAPPEGSLRLIGGSAFHHMAGLTRAQELLLQKPSKTKKEALQRKRWRLSLVFVDEISLTAPNLLAALHGSACYGRLDLSPEDSLSNIFGNLLCQILAGDFLQLNPVRARSLMEAFGVEVPGAPRYEKMDDQQRRKKVDIDEHGPAVFRTFLKQVILFRGSHRFRKWRSVGRALGDDASGRRSTFVCGSEGGLHNVFAPTGPVLQVSSRAVSSAQ